MTKCFSNNKKQSMDGWELKIEVTKSGEKHPISKNFPLKQKFSQITVWIHECEASNDEFE